MQDNDPFAELLGDDPFAELSLQATPAPISYTAPERSGIDVFAELVLDQTSNITNPIGSLLGTGLTDIFSYGELEDGKLTPTTAEERKPQNFLTKALDLLQRTQYASATFIDRVAEGGVDAIGKAFTDAVSEAWSPQQRPRFADLIRKHQPVWAEQNPVLTQLFGFGGDIALDPMTYFGTIGEGVKIALGTRTAVLSKPGVKIMEAEKAAALNLIDKINTKVAAVMGGSTLGKQDMQLLEQAVTAVDKRELGVADEILSKIQGVAGELPEGVIPFNIQKNIDQMKFNPITIAHESAEKTIAGLINAGNKALEMRPGLYAKVPFGDWLKLPYSDDVFAGVAEVARPLKEWLGKRHFIQEVGLALSRKHQVTEGPQGKLAPLHEDVLKMRDDLFAEEERLSAEEAKAAFRLFQDPKIDRFKVQKALYEADDASRIEEAGLGRTLNPVEALQIRENAIRANQLNQEELATFAQTRMNYDRRMELEVAAGKLDNVVTNYAFRSYTNYENADKYLQIKKWRQMGGGMDAYLGPAEKREFLLTQDAVAAGYNLDYDAANLYMLRNIISRRALAREEYLTGLKSFYGVKDPKDLPLSVQKDLAFISDHQFSAMGSNDLWLRMVRAWDVSQSVFRFAAVPLRPYFAFKQLFAQNPMQMYLESGRKVFKAIDPRISIPAMALLFRHHGFMPDNMAAKVANIPLQMTNFKFRSGIGKFWDSEQLYDEAKRQGIFKSVTGITGDETATTAEKLLKRHFQNYRLAMGNEAGAGAINLAREMLNFTKWGTYAEELSNLTMWMTGLATGNSPRQSMGMASRALFDYKNGLTEFQHQFARRFAFPFLSWKRFASELLFNTLVTHPGRISNVNKLVQNFLEGYNKYNGGETLTDDERRITPDYIFEQPSTLEKFDPATKDAIFKIFNSYTPIDAFESVATDPVTGKYDERRTFQKIFLSSLSPAIKFTLEQALNMDFFTGQKIDDPRYPGKKIGSNISPEEFLSNTAAALVAGKTGAPGALMAHFGGTAVGDNERARNAIKKALSWEELKNPRTGKMDVYINPTIAHALFAQFPGVKSFIRIEDESQTPRERFADLLMGVKTAKIDLQNQYGFRQYEFKKRIGDLKSEIRSLRRKGAISEAEKRQDELLQLLQMIALERTMIDPANIRGGQ